MPFDEFVGDDSDDKYILNQFLSNSKIKVETLFTIEKSSIDIKESSLFEIEKNYFVGLNKESSLLQRDNKYGVLQTLTSNNFINRNIIDINGKNSISWDILNTKIDSYEYDILKYKAKLSNKILNDDNYSKKDFQSDMKDWENENENILENISDKLNSILNRFNLELAKIDEVQKGFTDLIFKDLANGNIIKYENLSTGTKNLISTFIPLKIHTPKDSIILIDEPEISFYPDIQRELIDLYTKVGSNNQLIVATHSPLIASSFEPWEIVELKFDDKNQIYRELYYDDSLENHIDNYTLDPRMLTWTSILTKVFDLKEDSNFSFREKKLMEYASLKSEIKLLDDEEKKEKKFKELMKLSKLLGLQH